MGDFGDIREAVSNLWQNYVVEPFDAHIAKPIDQYVAKPVENEIDYLKNEVTELKNKTINFINQNAGDAFYNSSNKNDASIVPGEKGNLYFRLGGAGFPTTAAGTKGDWLLRQYGYSDHVVYSNDGVPHFRDADGDWYISSLPTRPVISGGEYLASVEQNIKETHPELNAEQQKTLVGEIIWKNNYFDLRDRIAHCTSPEQREQLIKAYVGELKKYEESGIPVAKDIKDIRDRQGMGSVVLSNAELYSQEILIIKEGNPDLTDAQASAEYARGLQAWNDSFHNMLADIKGGSNLYDIQQRINYYESNGVLKKFRDSGLDVDKKILDIKEGYGKIQYIQSSIPQYSGIEGEYLLDSFNILHGYIPKVDENGNWDENDVDIPTSPAGIPTLPGVQMLEDAKRVRDAYAQQFGELVEKVRKIPGLDFAMGYQHGLLGADGSYGNRSSEYKSGWNLSNNSVSKLIGAATKVAETAPPTFPGRGPMLSSELVTGGAIARSTVTNLPSNIYFSSSKENDSSASNFKNQGNDGNKSAYKKRLDQTPTNSADGEWLGYRGESTYVSNNPKVKALLNKDGVIGIKYNNGIPDFSPVSKGQVEIEGMTANRAKNFDKADVALAQERGVTTKEIKQWRMENNLTWHECNDTRTMQAVPSEINGTFGHLGGVGELNAAAK